MFYTHYLWIKLFRHWEYKLPAAMAGGVGYSFFRDIVGWYSELLETDPVLVLLAVTMIFLDWLTGTVKALCRWWKRIERFNIEKQRDAARKILIWFGVIGICVMLSNGFEREWQWMEHVAVLDYAALMLCAWVEGMSAAENIGADHLMHRIREIARRRKDVFTDTTNN